eukprot:3178150-Pyramimonas_sp.AAC.1
MRHGHSTPAKNRRKNRILSRVKRRLNKLLTVNPTPSVSSPSCGHASGQCAQGEVCFGARASGTRQVTWKLSWAS